jgi:hypothetical protein
MVKVCVVPVSFMVQRFCKRAQKNIVSVLSSAAKSYAKIRKVFERKSANVSFFIPKYGRRNRVGCRSFLEEETDERFGSKGEYGCCQDSAEDVRTDAQHEGIPHADGIPDATDVCSSRHLPAKG